jgi:threonine dehydrogenase-like Zn-dependent dehydrogenase
MKATCWEGKRTVRVEEVPDPTIIDSRDAIVRVTSTAICGSDLHLYNGFVPTMERGDILGHEFMGEVVETGPGVRSLKTGDRVVVPFTIACGECFMCRRDLFSCCENSNPNAAMAEKLWGHSPAGAFGYSHLLGGFAGGQAQYARVPFADVDPAGRRDRGVGCGTGGPHRHGQRLPARRRAGDRDRPLPLPAGVGPRAAERVGHDQL